MRLLLDSTTAWLVVALALLTQAAPATEGLDPAEALRIQSQLEPSPDELWRTIPWRISLLDAQRIAVRDEKPIFIWAMDGHPLGCT